MRKKMVLIGCGSAMFTQGLVADLLRNPAGEKWHLAICDIDAEVLAAMRKLVAKMIALAGADVELSASVDRAQLLPGADYVVTTIGVGKRRAWELDVFIPRKYGVYQPVGDTMMPGGISRAMRMVPAMLAIVRDVERLCPKARFINYANPMAILCRALNKATGFPLTGLCIGTMDTVWDLARLIEVPRERVTARAAGLNHLTFIFDFRVDGKDAWPLVREARARKQPEREPFSWDIFDRFGVFPTPGDRHITEFFTERFIGGAYYGKKLGVDAFSFEGTIEHGDRIHEGAMALANSPDPLPADFLTGASGEHEQLMEIISSFEHDSQRLFFANVPNRGAIPNLPPDAVLEMPAVAGAGGFSPLRMNDFPDAVAAIVQKNLAIVSMAAEAALAGSVEMFEEAILLGGYMNDTDAVHAMVRELLDAHAQYLPQFAR